MYSHTSNPKSQAGDDVHLAGGSLAASEAIVLAAGKGTRMQSRLPKVLHALAGKPMLVRVLDALAASGFTCPLVVTGYGSEAVESVAGKRARMVVQPEQLGTGHAARVAVDLLPPAVERVLLVHGDEPLIPPTVYTQMLDLQARTRVPVVLLTTRVQDTRGFGRVIRVSGEPVALVQESDLTSDQRQVDEVNLGAYVFDVPFLRRYLPLLQAHHPKGEYYLTDLVAVAAEQSSASPLVAAVTIEGGEEILGVNDLIQLEQATATIYRSTNRRLMSQGVTIVNSATTFIDEEVQIEPDVIVHPFTTIAGVTHIGTGSVIGPGTNIVSSRIGRRCHIVSSTIEGSVVGDDVMIGPYAHLRQGADIDSGVELGNYAEVKASKVGTGTKMHHFSYLGDASVGRNVNIGAGTITCNFDGRAKHATVIEDGAFIGSDTMLRAPVTVGRGAVTGAGSVVTKDVIPGTTVAGVPARPLEARAPESTDLRPRTDLRSPDGGEGESGV